MQRNLLFFTLFLLIYSRKIHGCSEAAYYAFPDTCSEENLELSIDSGSNSAGFLISSATQHYAGNLTCSVNLVPPAETSVVLFLRDIHLRPNCTDNVTVHISETEKATFCNNSVNVENKAWCSSSEMRLVFHSGLGSTVGFRGFTFLFTTSQSCNVTKTSLLKGFPKFITKPIKPRIKSKIFIISTRPGIGNSSSDNPNTIFIVAGVFVAVAIIFGLIKLCLSSKNEETEDPSDDTRTHFPAGRLNNEPLHRAFSNPPPYKECVSDSKPPPYERKAFFPTAPPPPYEERY